MRIGIGILLEDKKENVLLVSQEIPVLCFHANYNNDIHGKNIHRIYTWYDILNKITRGLND